MKRSTLLPGIGLVCVLVSPALAQTDRELASAIEFPELSAENLEAWGGAHRAGRGGAGRGGDRVDPRLRPGRARGLAAPHAAALLGHERPPAGLHMSERPGGP